MDFKIDYEKLKQMPKLDTSTFHCGGDIFVENDKVLIKALKDDMNTMVSYLRNIPEHEHVIKPLEVGEIVSSTSTKPEYKTIYRMKYLENAKTLLSLYKEDLPYEKKVEYCKQLFDALQFLHQYIVVGDIHYQNILISDDNAYLVDLDDSKKPQWLHYPINCFYYINSLEKYGSSKYTDVVKLYIECLSFILRIPFSSYIFRYGYPWFHEVFTSINLPDQIRSFVDLKQSDFKKLGEEAYDFERFITPEILELKPKLNHLK